MCLPHGVVNHEFEPQLGQTRYYDLGIYCFSTKHVARCGKIKEYLVQKQDNVFWVDRHDYPWNVVSVSLCCKNPSNHVGLVQMDNNIIIISSKRSHYDIVAIVEKWLLVLKTITLTGTGVKNNHTHRYRC